MFLMLEQSLGKLNWISLIVSLRYFMPLEEFQKHFFYSVIIDSRKE